MRNRLVAHEPQSTKWIHAQPNQPYMSLVLYGKPDQNGRYVDLPRKNCANYSLTSAFSISSGDMAVKRFFDKTQGGGK